MTAPSQPKLTRAQERTLRYLSTLMWAPSHRIGAVIIDAGLSKSADKFSVGSAICGRLRSLRLVSYVPEEFGYRLTEAGRAALAAAEKDHPHG